MGFALGSTHPTVKRDFFNSLAHHLCEFMTALLKYNPPLALHPKPITKTKTN
ncbi:MAG: hypothetical protein ACI8WB_003305 [Phenylobacterium sp.]|jgi:hypothetical protein